VGLLHEALPASTLVVAIDPGKVSNRVWLSSGEAGAVVAPLSLPVLRPGLDQLQRLVIDHAGVAGPVFAIEATGVCTRPGSASSTSAFPEQCGCSHPRRPPLPALSWARGGSRPTTVTVLR
jgi:hypothetical protein